MCRYEQDNIIIEMATIGYSFKDVLHTYVSRGMIGRTALNEESDSLKFLSNIRTGHLF